MSSVAESGQRRVGLNDIAMLTLAVVSLGLLIYVTFFQHPEWMGYWAFVIDTAICGIFLIEFLFRWRRCGWERKFPLRNWYEILGMIPMAHPALRGFRLIRVVVLVVRLARTADRTFGERFTQRFVERLSRPIVTAIKKPVTVAVLDEVVRVLQAGHYPRNIARSLNEDQATLRAIVVEKLKEDPQAGRLSALPFHDEIVRSVVDTVMRVTLDVLHDPRTDQFVNDVVRENSQQIREAVRDGHAEEEPSTEPVRTE